MDYTDLLIKLGLSAILGFAIGLERELKRKPLGLKTCLVISIISCLLTIVSIKATYNLPHTSYEYGSTSTCRSNCIRNWF